jgi:hypothetical protein
VKKKATRWGIWMSIALTAALLGLVFGATFVAALALYFVFSRPYRRVRNFFAIAFGNLLIITLSIGSIILLQKSHIQARSLWDDADFYFAISIFFGMVMIIRSEMKWRKAVGLGDRNQRSAKPRRVGVGLVLVVSYCAFQTGVGSVVLLGPRLARGIPVWIAIFSTLCSVVGTCLCGYVLAKILQKQQIDRG